LGEGKIGRTRPLDTSKAAGQGTGDAALTNCSSASTNGSHQPDQPDGTEVRGSPEKNRALKSIQLQCNKDWGKSRQHSKESPLGDALRSEEQSRPRVIQKSNYRSWITEIHVSPVSKLLPRNFTKVIKPVLWKGQKHRVKLESPGSVKVHFSAR